jgi:hypothetical protein
MAGRTGKGQREADGDRDNVAGGFEGPLDDERHRGTVGGWKAASLPWLQG